MTASRAVAPRSMSLPAGDGSLESLYHGHCHELNLWLGARVPPSNVEDASQAVWERIISSYDTHFDGANFRAWMFRIARNYLIDMNRRRRTLAAFDEDSFTPSAPGNTDPVDILIDEEYRERLAACIQGLGYPRKAIVQARIAGDGYKACAAALKITVQQARQHFFKAKKLLETCMHSHCARTT